MTRKAKRGQIYLLVFRFFGADPASHTAVQRDPMQDILQNRRKDQGNQPADDENS
jgi:hypothetical protein